VTFPSGNEKEIVMPYIPEKILERWCEYVNRSNVENIVKLYDDKSTLFPTFSPDCMTSLTQIKDYFQKIAEKQNVRVAIHPETLSKHEIGENKYIMTGIYSFYVVSGEEKREHPSRFTFILDTARDRPILHHHSSRIPGTPL
jgi:hypothetical protein